MNYFELLEIPLTLDVNKALVRKKYLELSKRYHPDYFVNSGEDEQQYALEMSALLNKALKAFSNREETIGYVLQIKGRLEENEKYQLPPVFLMEMLEMNVAAEEAHGPEEGGRLKEELLTLEKEIYEPVQEIIENYREGITTEKELLQVKEFYFKKKYLQRLYHQLERKL